MELNLVSDLTMTLLMIDYLFQFYESLLKSHSKDTLGPFIVFNFRQVNLIFLLNIFDWFPFVLCSRFKFEFISDGEWCFFLILMT